MHFTIKRLRILILVGGVLLLSAMAIFLAVGKWKNPFNRRDLPSRLGIEIQQEANGVDYTQAHGGHTLFKIHASKVIQLKKGNALLHDVKIELYGEDGSRVDRIEGGEFEYDKKAGTAVAAGPVEITLMRPGVAPAIAPKAAVNHAVGDKRKGAPVATAAETAARGEIHVKTSGLTFDQKSGMAKTSQHVDFSMVQGSGSSMGATFDSQQGMLVLDSAVELAAQRGAETVRIHAQHAEFDRDDRICRLHAAIADYRGGKANSGDAKILFREDGSAVRLDAMNGFALTTQTGSHLAAPVGYLEFDQKNQPRHGHMQGGVTMDSASQSEGRQRQVRGAAPTVELEFSAQGHLRHAHLERDVTMDTEELSAQAGQQRRMKRHWRSPVADIDFRDSAQGQIKPSAVRGNGGVTITGENQLGAGPAAPFHLSADNLTGEFDSNSALTTMNGTGHAGMEETTALGARQTTSGDRIEAHFAALAQNGGQRAGQDAATQIQSASVQGHVLLTQTPAAKPGVPPSTMRATAGRADYQGQGEWLHLTLTPRLEDGAIQITADKLDVSRASGDAFAHGNVKASWSDVSEGAKNTAGGTAVALGGQGPAHAVSAEAKLRQSTGEITFHGQARLWQQANSVTAPTIVLDRLRQTLLARTTNAAEPVLAVLLSASVIGPGAGPGQNGSKTNQPSVIRVRGGELKYSDAERKALMRAGVLGAVTAETGTATSSSDEVEVTLLPAGSRVDKNSGPASGQAQVDHMTARGHVVLSSEGRRGTGEQLVYTGATNEYVLTGTISAPPEIYDPSRGTVSGEALIFRSRDDSITVEGSGQKTTTETTAPK
ncbi:MAG: LptA/OstA family protein [Terracidiphilus sp.]